jgi:mono/diheme cytochrome c family protein
LHVRARRPRIVEDELAMSMSRLVLGVAAATGSVIALGIIGCEGPQPLEKAIRPDDEKAYRSLLANSDETPKQAFLRTKAAELGISIDTAQERDTALSSTVNPFHARNDPSAVSRGAVIYSHECADCHGKNVDGRGPLLPMPLESLDFHRTSMRMDITAHGGAIKKWFKTIENGATAQEKGPDGEPITLTMPAFGSQLAREQIWLVITYLQSLDADIPSAPKEDAR